MYDRILCIYPVDSTTDFLVPIPNLIQQHFGDVFELYRIDSSEESYLKAIYKMEMCPQNSLLIFIGHGSNAGFHCVNEINNETVIFLNTQNIQRLRDKNIYAFSCKSSFYLKNFSGNSNSWLGFDDLPTESENFPITDDEKLKFLELYKKILIEAVIRSIMELVSSKSYSKSYSMLKLVLNKEMIKLAKDKANSNNRKLAEIIYETKKGIKFHEFINP